MWMFSQADIVIPDHFVSVIHCSVRRAEGAEPGSTVVWLVDLCVALYNMQYAVCPPPTLYAYQYLILAVCQLY